MQSRKTESSGGDEGIQHVDAKAIKTSLHARVSYLLSFIGFNSADVQALQNVAPLIRPHITAIVDSMYRKLMSYDITKASLIEPSGAHVPREEIVTKERDRIRYMTSFMSHWVLKLFIADWEDIQTFAYFDRVGVSHVGQSAFRHRGERGSLNVDYVHIALLLGVLTEALTTRILGFDKLTLEEKTAALSALTKAMWIQNDLISRHYVVPVEKLLPPEPPAPAHPYVPADDEPKCPFSGASSSCRDGIPEEEEEKDEPWPDDSDDETTISSTTDDDGPSTSGASSSTPVDDNGSVPEAVSTLTGKMKAVNLTNP